MADPTLSAFPIEEVARLPLPGMMAPGAIAFTPDDRHITYLWSPDHTLTRQLYAYDPQTDVQRLLVTPAGGGTTEANVSLEEALQRERQRQMGVGVTSYAWAKKAARLLIPLQGSVYVQDGEEAPLREVIARGDHPILDPQFSPDGAWIAYVQDAELYVVDALSSQPRQLTRGARGTGKTH